MSVLQTQRERRATLLTSLDKMLDRASAEKRDLTYAEDAAATEGMKKLKVMDARIAELEEAEIRIDATAKHDLEVKTAVGGFGSAYTTDPQIYTDPLKNPSSPSFFRDLRSARLGDGEASDRLRRNTASRGLEKRAGDMSTVAGTGGQFAPPLWLVQEFVALARPARVTADLCFKQELPAGISSVNLPTVATGTVTAVQAAQNTALADTAATTGAVTSGISLIGGKQTVSHQLLQQSGIPFDRVVLGDLAADYAKQLDIQVLTGSGAAGQLRGLANAAGITTVTFTTAAPKVVDATTSANSFYNAVIRGINSITTTRFMPPTAIIMHPSRWSWILEALDTASRPLVLAEGGSFNPIGTGGAPVAQGQVGVFLGLPVIVDPNVPTNVGGTQDVVWVARLDDAYLWESQPLMESFDATYADQASVLFRVIGYSAFIPDRYGKSLALITGTGLVAPTL